MLVAKPMLDTVQSIITIKSAGKMDFHVNLRKTDAYTTNVGDVEYRETINNHPDRKIKFQNWAMSQVLEVGKVPKAFFDRCGDALQRDIYNEHVSSKDKVMLFRRAPNPVNQIADAEWEIRAVMSNVYGIIDDDQVFPAVVETLKEIGITQYTVLEYDDHVTRLMVEFPDTHTSYAGHATSAGLIITNSETGHSAVWVEPTVFHNQLHFHHRGSLRAQAVDCRIVHRGEIENKRLKEMVLKNKEIAQVGILQLADAWNNRVSKPEAIAFVGRIDMFPDRLKAIFSEKMSDIEDISKAEVAQSIIQLAATLPLFQRIQVEGTAGSYIGLFNNYKARMASVMEEI